MKDRRRYYATAGCVVGSLFWCSYCVADSGKQITYYYTDHSGSVLAETDALGNVLSTPEYRPFGRAVIEVDKPGVGYSGHVYDGDVALNYMQARYYAADVGRFLSKDPVAPKPGAVFGLKSLCIRQQ